MSEGLNKIKKIDEIRVLALEYLSMNKASTYQDAWRDALEKIIGSKDSKFLTSVEEGKNIVDMAKEELSSGIKTELYTEEQLKQMIIAKRMGIDVSSFINVFFTAEQIKFITIVAAGGMDIEPYKTNLKFDPEQELEKLYSSSDSDSGKEEDKVLVLNAT